MSAQPTPLVPLEDSAVLEYAETARSAFLAASKKAIRATEGWFRIAEQLILIRATEPTLFTRLTRALEHLRAPSAPSADLTVYAWQGSGPGSNAPPSPPAWYANQRNEPRDEFIKDTRFDFRGELPAFNTAGIRTAFRVQPSELHLLDNNRNEAFYWIEDGAKVPYWEAGAPFHRVFAWWMGERGIWLLHTAAVGMADGGVLITGPPGAGKSTSALACANAGLGYAGDDYCLMQVVPEPRVHSLYNTGKLKSRWDLERFAQFASLGIHAEWLDNLKAQMFLQFVPGIRVVSGFPLRAIVVPHVGSSNGTTLSLLSAPAALQAMLSTIRQVPNNGRALRPMAELVRKIPCYRLNAGPDLAAIPPLIRELLQRNQ